MQQIFLQTHATEVSVDTARDDPGRADRLDRAHQDQGAQAAARLQVRQRLRREEAPPHRLRQGTLYFTLSFA